MEGRQQPGAWRGLLNRRTKQNPPTHRPTHPPTHLQEGMTDGFDEQTAYGEIYGMDDPTMVRWK